MVEFEPPIDRTKLFKNSIFEIGESLNKFYKKKAKSDNQKWVVKKSVDSSSDDSDRSKSEELSSGDESDSTKSDEPHVVSKSEAILKEFPQMIYDSLSHICYIDEDQKEINKGKIVVVCAGTSDLPVAREAMLTAQFLGNEVELVSDVGVAGIHRLFHRLDTIQGANVLVVCAGMEGALASVVGGLVDKPVIAVPTSIGYGANFDGLSALLAMLNSCASGVSVVNIDNGFGAGFMAHTINCLGGKK